MSYFAHGFTKAFVGTKGDQVGSLTATATGNGMILEAGIPTVALKNTGAPNALGLGSYGFFNKDTHVSVLDTSIEVITGQPLIFASAAVPQNDKIGPFHGGYAESNKSKYINPKYVTNFYKYEDAVPEQAILHVGNTNLGQTCEFEFLCGETYNLHINLFGAPVLRVMNRDSFRNLAAYTGCCPDGAIAPVPVDSTLVMINWANQIIETPYLQDFIRPVVYDQAGQPWFATAAEAVAAGYADTFVWTLYVEQPVVPNTVAGLRLEGAYVDTQFSTCSFQCSDYYNKEVVQMVVTMVDEGGDPCTYDGICIETECCGFGGEGFGDTYLKELIMCESYLQNSFSSDPRIREITEGNALRDAIDRQLFYTKYVIQHGVPRPYNPSGIYDTDNYNLCIYLPSGATATELEALMEAWLTAAGNPIGADITANGVQTFTHDACPVTAI